MDASIYMADISSLCYDASTVFIVIPLRAKR